ncbi:MAG TPA: response regulator transcription factor [Candidatus Limivivens merdigallinarum]|uniref:Stage 0 sporulation protein A homolog n=1 Tax=Candidatus Limivivens merdigallinarum TaxID=2840859 RepID=A0A9D1D2T3_9FIRM|nr:response regulator transcription factor [Candidatus Limivivens merdigallinarum]
MIFCVEDERNIRELLVYTLTTIGYEAMGLDSGKELFRALANERPELILLDIMLPGEDGYQILSRLKDQESTREIPVIMVTAKGAEFDKVRGLDGGADDYITKPFGMMEFIARVKAVLRRTGKQGEPTVLKYASIVISVNRREVTENGRKVELTLKEFEVLRYLMENRGIVLTRDQLLGHIWGYDFGGETRTVDVHIRSLRQKLGESGKLVETVRGVGYRIGEVK